MIQYWYRETLQALLQIYLTCWENFSLESIMISRYLIKRFHLMYWPLICRYLTSVRSFSLNSTVTDLAGLMMILQSESHLKVYLRWFCNLFCGKVLTHAEAKQIVSSLNRLVLMLGVDSILLMQIKNSSEDRHELCGMHVEIFIFLKTASFQIRR